VGSHHIAPRPSAPKLVTSLRQAPCSFSFFHFPFGTLIGDATITIIRDPTAGTIRITIANEKTATLECGRYLDALQLSIGDIVSPLWLGQVLVAAHLRRRLDFFELTGGGKA
jgi:hypothetical protein